jgi:hypothetical protein
MRYANLLKLVSFLAPFLACQVSNGQQSTALASGRPIEGATAGLYLPNSVQSDLSPGVKVHMDVYGKRCVMVAAYSHAKTDFRKIFGGGQPPQGSEKDKGQSSSASGQGDDKSKNFEHIVSAQNHCSQTIRLRVCYLGSQNCVPLDVPGHGHQQASLGIASGMPGFRYQYIEQF